MSGHAALLVVFPESALPPLPRGCYSARGMTLEEARRILGLSEKEDVKDRLEEFLAARERIADMVRNAPNETLALRFQDGLIEFDKALAVLRENSEKEPEEVVRAREWMAAARDSEPKEKDPVAEAPASPSEPVTPAPVVAAPAAPPASIPDPVSPAPVETAPVASTTPAPDSVNPSPGAITPPPPIPEQVAPAPAAITPAASASPAPEPTSSAPAVAAPVASPASVPEPITPA
ncbi:MAG TPA: hypothetical protein VGE67_14260, partial [Haloferula sp.]